MQRSFTPTLVRKPNPAKSKPTVSEKPKPVFPTDCKNDLFAKKLPLHPDEPITLEELTRTKSDIRGTYVLFDTMIYLFLILEDIFIQDMFVMDQLEEINNKIKNLRISAKSRTDSSVELGYVVFFV